jgi:hypothetical protein
MRPDTQDIQLASGHPSKIQQRETDDRSRRRSVVVHGPRVRAVEATAAGARHVEDAAHARVAGVAVVDGVTEELLAVGADGERAAARVRDREEDLLLVEHVASLGSMISHMLLYIRGIRERGAYRDFAFGGDGLAGVVAAERVDGLDGESVLDRRAEAVAMRLSVGAGRKLARGVTGCYGGGGLEAAEIDDGAVAREEGAGLDRRGEGDREGGNNEGERGLHDARCRAS